MTEKVPPKILFLNMTTSKMQSNTSIRTKDFADSIKDFMYLFSARQVLWRYSSGCIKNDNSVTRLARNISRKEDIITWILSLSRASKPVYSPL